MDEALWIGHQYDTIRVDILSNAEFKHLALSASLQVIHGLHMAKFS